MKLIQYIRLKSIDNGLTEYIIPMLSKMDRNGQFNWFDREPNLATVQTNI